MTYRSGPRSGGRSSGGGSGRSSGGRGGFRGGRGASGGGRGAPRGGPRRGGRGGPRRGGRNRPRDLREASVSGNQRERISIESGEMVLIDQFMLANPQLIGSLRENIDADPALKDRFIKEFGGVVVRLAPGTYRIERDPFAFSIIVHPEEYQFEDQGQLTEKASSNAIGQLFVDTRCLAMFDKELLDDSDLLLKYQDLWFSGEEKACRDLLRDNGGAVRYGFDRFGDELGIYNIADDNVVCLWPDAAHQQNAQPAEMAAGE